MKSVNVDHSLTRTLFGTQQKCDIYRTIFRFYRVKKGCFGYSLPRTLLMIGTQQKFHVLRVQSVNFDHSLTRTLFGTQQKCDIYRTIFRFYRVKKGRFGYSLPCTLFGTQQKCDIHR